VWIKKLIDLARRNNLLFFRDLHGGTLDLTEAPAGATHALLQSGREGAAGVPLNRLEHGVQQQVNAAAGLKESAVRAQMNLQERGLNTLFMGLGAWRRGSQTTMGVLRMLLSC
jgi:hypothetical protein